MSVLEEVEALYHVDLDRVYLTGHSMGGGGTWWFGPRHVDVFAAVGPTASFNPGGYKALREARTGVFIYHSTDDFLAVQPIRGAADALLEMGADVVYLQLEDRGHSFPPEADAELFDVFRGKRLQGAKASSAWPRSSFARKPSADEAKYLGDPAAAWGGPAEGEGLKALVAEIERGGGGAERAAATVAATKPEGAAKAVAKVLRSAKATDDARAWAARCLGDLGDVGAVDALSAVVEADAPARLVRESAAALRKLGSPAAAGALAKGLETWRATHDRLRTGQGMDYSDWETVCFTMAEVVEAYAVCGPAATAAAAIDRAAVRGVIGAGDVVEVSARAGQDAGVPRGRLAEAVARAYATLAAPEAMFDALKAAAAQGGGADSAIERGRASPFPRPPGR